MPGTDPLVPATERPPAAAGRSEVRRRRLLALCLLLLCLPPLSLAGVLAVEGHDPACASCHLPPETEFVARSTGLDRPVDLASAHAHASPALRCIDCHAAPGLAGRLEALGLAARDSWRFLSGDYVVVGTEYLPLGESRDPIGDRACLACHDDRLADERFENHYHALLRAPEAPSGLSCAACHAAHLEHPEPPWFDDDDLAPACDACHSAMGGPSRVLGAAGDR